MTSHARLTVSVVGVSLALLAAACGKDDASDSPSGGASGSGGASSGGASGSGGTTGGSAGADAGPPAPLSYPVDAVGPFQVGHRTVDTTYQAPGGVGARTITVHLWYPTNDTTGTHAKYHKVFNDDDVFEGASLADSAYPAGYPVHVFSHGDQGFAGNASDQAHYFASHGWLYIGPDHLGNLLGDGGGPHPLDIYFERPLDVRASLDAVRDLPSSDPLAGKVDLTHVLMSGHSFGTFTAWSIGGSAFDLDAIRATCTAGGVVDCTDDKIAVFSTDLSEKRALAVISQAGGPLTDFFGQTGCNSVRVPYFLMGGTDDGADVSGMYALVSGVDLSFIDVQGGCHQLFGLGGCPMIPDDVGYPIVNTYDLAFARYHVWGDRSDDVTQIVMGTKVVSDRVTFQHKN